MTHDPLCIKTADPYSMKKCQCDLIDKVRADERARCIIEVYHYFNREDVTSAELLQNLYAGDLA